MKFFHQREEKDTQETQIENHLIKGIVLLHFLTNINPNCTLTW